MPSTRGRIRTVRFLLLGRPLVTQFTSKPLIFLLYMNGSNNEEDLLLDSSLLNYVREQLALLETIPRFESEKPNVGNDNVKGDIQMNDEDQIVLAHDRVKVFWPNRKRYYFGEVLETDDARKGSHIIRYEDVC